MLLHQLWYEGWSLGANRPPCLDFGVQQLYCVCAFVAVPNDIIVSPKPLTSIPLTSTAQLWTIHKMQSLVTYGRKRMFRGDPSTVQWHVTSTSSEI